MKHTKKFLSELENIIAGSDYTLRYEKGQFRPGYCFLHEQKIVIVNKFYTTEGKINALLDILKTAPLDMQRMDEKSKKIYNRIVGTPLQAIMSK